MLGKKVNEDDKLAGVSNLEESIFLKGDPRLQWVLQQWLYTPHHTTYTHTHTHKYRQIHAQAKTQTSHHFLNQVLNSY